MRHVPKDDLRFLLKLRGITDSATVEELIRVARRNGWFGIVSEVLNHAGRLNGGGVPGKDDIFAALEDLQLLSNRGK